MSGPIVGTLNLRKPSCRADVGGSGVRSDKLNELFQVKLRSGASRLHQLPDSTYSHPAVDRI